MKRILLFVLLTIGAYAQSPSHYTQYMYNTIMINPAYAGTRDAFSIFLMHRTQWVGLEGAPSNSSISLNTPIKGTNLGLGVSFENDKIGPSDNNSIAVDLSYSIQATSRYKLNFGLKSIANLLNVDFTKLSYFQGADPAYVTNVDNYFSPNLGFGLYYYSDKNYVGLSMPSLFETKYYDRSATAKNKPFVINRATSLNLIAGHVFDLSSEIKFKPSVLVKAVEGAPLQTDIAANFMFSEKFIVGTSYRWGSAVSGSLGFQATDSWFMGYSYDFDTTPSARYNSGSHEIFLRYDLAKAYDKIKSPRFF